MTELTVTASNLVLRYGRVVALDGVSVALRNGVTGVLGPNGAGKTTLLRVLATATVPDSGELTILGSNPRTVPGRLAILPSPTSSVGSGTGTS